MTPPRRGQGRPPREVVAYDLRGQEVGRYASAARAGEAYGVSEVALRRVLASGRPSVGGVFFAFALAPVPSLARVVVAYDDAGRETARYATQRDAQEALGLPRGALHAAMRRGCRAGGWRWRSGAEAAPRAVRPRALAGLDEAGCVRVVYASASAAARDARIDGKTMRALLTRVDLGQHVRFGGWRLVRFAPDLLIAGGYGCMCSPPGVTPRGKGAPP